MTTQTLTAGKASGNPVSSILKALRARFEKRALYMRTYRELQSLTDRELDDIGLSRSMIHEVATQAADLEHR